MILFALFCFVLFFAAPQQAALFFMKSSASCTGVRIWKLWVCLSWHVYNWPYASSVCTNRWMTVLLLSIVGWVWVATWWATPLVTHIPLSRKQQIAPSMYPVPGAVPYLEWSKSLHHNPMKSGFEHYHTNKLVKDLSPSAHVLKKTDTSTRYYM